MTEPLDGDQLQPGDTLDDRGVDDVLDEGFSPPDREPRDLTDPVTYGAHATLEDHLAAEEPEVWVDGSAFDDAEESDPESADRDEVGEVRTGRLAESTEADTFASDVGIDGAGASAEEAAMHTIGDEPREAVAVVQSWLDAVNARDVETALALCDPEVVVGGPRGEGRGHDLMRAWLARSGIGLEPQEPLVEDEGRIDVRCLARWRVADAPAGVPAADPAETWVSVEVVDGAISAVRRYESAP